MKKYIDLFKNEKKIKVDFHGNRDLYSFIKQISLETGRLNTFKYSEVDIIKKYIERNFGGIDYEININMIFGFNDVKTIFRDFNKKKMKEIKIMEK